MSDVKNTPKLRFPQFSGDWEKHRFGNLAVIRRGLTYKPSDIAPQGVRVLRSSNIDEGVFILKNDDVFVNETAVNIPFANENDILITSANGSSRLVGKHALVQGVAQKTVHGGFMLIATAKNPYFINTLMSTSWYDKFISGYVLGGNGAIGNLSKKDLEEQAVFVPAPAEQTAIGNFFRQIDELITLHQNKLNHTKALKKGLLQKMFPKNGETVPEIRFSEFSGDWERCKLGEVGETFTGLSGKTKDDFGHGNAKYITYLNVFKNPIADLSEVEAIEIDEKQEKVRYGDVLFTTSSETPEEVGMSSVWLGNIDNVYLNSFCFGYRPNIEFNPYYLGSVLRSSSVRQEIVLLAQGISRYNISKKKMMEIEIPVPTLQEQTAIGNFFRQLNELIALRQRKLEHLKELKRALLQQMFV